MHVALDVQRTTYNISYLHEISIFNHLTFILVVLHIFFCWYIQLLLFRPLCHQWLFNWLHWPVYLLLVGDDGMGWLALFQHLGFQHADDGTKVASYLLIQLATSQWYRKSNGTKWFLQAARPRLDPANEVHLFLVSRCPRPLFLHFDLSGAFSPSGLICRSLSYWRRPFNDVATRLYL